MASRTSTPRSRSRSRSSTGSSDSSDTTMNDTPTALAPARPRQASHSNPAASTQTTSVSADPTFSLLLSLPRELRNRIYIFALTSQYPFWWPNASPVQHNVAVHLLTASRQIHQETAPILYTHNKFLFTHPSDCNIFRVVASPYSQNITSVYFRIREKDLRLWTAYLGSKTAERSLKADLPQLKNLWIFMRCGTLGTPAVLAHLGAAQGGGVQGMQHGMLPPAIAVQVQAVQNALGQQVQALQQQVHNLTQSLVGAVQGHGGGGQAATQQQQQTGAPAQNPGDNANGNGNVNGNGTQHGPPPPPPPPPPAMPFVQFTQGGFQPVQHQHQQQPHPHIHPPPQAPHTHGPPTATNNNQQPQPQSHLHHHHHHHHQHPPPHQHTLYSSFLRFERELGIESLCLSLQETRPQDTDVKIVCILRVPSQEVVRLLHMYPEELTVDRNGDARTRFRKLHGVEVSLEVSGYEVGGVGVGGGMGG